MESERLYEFTKKELSESGIDFRTIPKQKIIEACKGYNGRIRRPTYDAIIRAIDEIYQTT